MDGKEQMIVPKPLKPACGNWRQRMFSLEDLRKERDKMVAARDEMSAIIEAHDRLISFYDQHDAIHKPKKKPRKSRGTKVGDIKATASAPRGFWAKVLEGVDLSRPSGDIWEELAPTYHIPKKKKDSFYAAIFAARKKAA
jgi:hypothetical protein